MDSSLLIGDFLWSLQGLGRPLVHFTPLYRIVVQVSPFSLLIVPILILIFGVVEGWASLEAADLIELPQSVLGDDCLHVVSHSNFHLTLVVPPLVVAALSPHLFVVLGHVGAHAHRTPDIIFDLLGNFLGSICQTFVKPRDFLLPAFVVLVLEIFVGNVVPCSLEVLLWIVNQELVLVFGGRLARIHSNGRSNGAIA